MVRLQGGLRALLVGSEPHGGRLKAMAGVDIIIGRFDKHKHKQLRLEVI
jgi:hypothetical protein